MKLAPSALFFASGSLLLAATPPAFRFADNLPRLPELSLSNAAKQSFGQPVVAEATPIAAALKERTPPPRLTSAMPIVAPADVDRRMPMVAPAEGVDYRMIVKDPAIESTR